MPSVPPLAPIGSAPDGHSTAIMRCEGQARDAAIVVINSRGNEMRSAAARRARQRAPRTEGAVGPTVAGVARAAILLLGLVCLVVLDGGVGAGAIVHVRACDEPCLGLARAVPAAAL